MSPSSGGSCGRDRGSGAATPARFAVACRSAQERQDLNARYNSRYARAEFAPVAGAPYRSRMVGLDTGDVRVLDLRESGGLRGRAAWRDDAFGAWFAWGPGGGREQSADTAPRLVVAGAGTDAPIAQVGDVRSLRIALRGAAFEALEAAMAGPLGGDGMTRAGLRRPHADAQKEWRLQQRILRAASFAEAAVERGVDVPGALDAAAREVVADLLDVLGDARDRRRLGDRSPLSRRRLVDDAIALLETADDEPSSVADVCRRLRVAERTLQRAFHENLGIGLRAYERRRRLRGVHGTILAEGDRRSITAIAMHFGFWHLGRFAGAYAAMFGCSPSETRERIWGNRHPPDASPSTRRAA